MVRSLRFSLVGQDTRLPPSDLTEPWLACCMVVDAVYVFAQLVLVHLLWVTGLLLGRSSEASSHRARPFGLHLHGHCSLLLITHSVGK